MVDDDALGKITAQIMHENAENIGETIAIDGKAIRSTGKKGKVHSFLQIVTAYATESGVTLSQSTISHEDKTNEIPVFQPMLDYLDIKETITADAMLCPAKRQTSSGVWRSKRQTVNILIRIRMIL